MSGWVTKRLSEYEGQKRMERSLERIANGTAPTEPAKKHRAVDANPLCEVCQRRARSLHFVPSLILGRRIKPFMVRGVLACRGCKDSMTRTVGFH